MTDAELNELILTRELDNTPQVVFEDWIYANKLSKWWGPKGYTNPVCTVHAKVAGALQIHTTAPDGRVYATKGLFHEIKTPERIVMTIYTLDGNDLPILEVLLTVTFTPLGDDKTMLKVRSEIIRSGADARVYIKGMREAWIQSLDRLTELTVR